MEHKWIEGVYESDIKCPNCKKYAVESYIPYPEHEPWIIWHDCLYCGNEFDGEQGEAIYGHLAEWKYIDKDKVR